MVTVARTVYDAHGQLGLEYGPVSTAISDLHMIWILSLSSIPPRVPPCRLTWCCRERRAKYLASRRNHSLLEAFSCLAFMCHSERRLGTIRSCHLHLSIHLTRPLRRADILTYMTDTWYVLHVTH